MEFYVGARLEVVLERLEAFDECGATFCWAGFEKNRVAILLQVLYAICVGVLLRAAFTFKLKAFEFVLHEPWKLLNGLESHLTPWTPVFPIRSTRRAEKCLAALAHHRIQINHLVAHTALKVRIEWL